MKSKVSAKGLAEAIVVLAGGATLLAFLGPLHWILDLTSHFRLHYAAILGVSAVIMWARKARRQAIAAGIGCLINASVIAAATWQPGRVEGETVLLVLSANVHTLNKDRQSIQKLVHEKNPNVIILAEVDERWVSDLDHLRQDYPYGITEPREDNFGMLLWSKTALVSTQTFFMGLEQLPTIKATFDTPRGKVDLWGAHPLPPGSKENTESRNAQLRELAMFIEKDATPTVLAGDLNTTPWNHAFKQLTKRGLRSASRWYQATWPSPLGPLGIPLDHCLYSEGLCIKKLEVCRNIGSDHRPIFAEVGFTK